MAGIPIGALRRALAEMASGAGRGISRAYDDAHIVPGAAMGLVGGGVAGGAYGLNEVSDGGEHPEASLYVPGGALSGLALGLGGGVLAKLMRMGMRGAGGGAAGFSRGLREALASEAAERGMGRSAMREAADLDDAARFHDRQFYDEAARTGTPVAELRARAQRDVPLIEEMRTAGQRPFSRAPSAMDEMNELGAANRILSRLRRERRALADPRQNGAYADPDELADLDEQIAELERLLGM